MSQSEKIHHAACAGSKTESKDHWKLDATDTHTPCGVNKDDYPLSPDRSDIGGSMGGMSSVECARTDGAFDTKTVLSTPHVSGHLASFTPQAASQSSSLSRSSLLASLQPQSLSFASALRPRMWEPLQMPVLPTPLAVPYSSLHLSQQTPWGALFRERESGGQDFVHGSVASLPVVDSQPPGTLDVLVDAVLTRMNSVHPPLNAATSAPTTDKPCACKHTRCLKLYCYCFHSGKLCDPSWCKCKQCQNTTAENGPHGARTRAVSEVSRRRADAFDSRPKRARGVGQGCACKKNKCLLKYCLCKANNIACSSLCSCSSCENGNVETVTPNPPSGRTSTYAE